MEQNEIHRLYFDLFKKYGSPEKYWPQWCRKEKTPRDREVIVIGAILTQRTSWRGDIRGLLEEKLEDVREKLLSLYGIGPETADTML